MLLVALKLQIPCVLKFCLVMEMDVELNVITEERFCTNVGHLKSMR